MTLSNAAQAGIVRPMRNARSHQVAAGFLTATPARSSALWLTGAATDFEEVRSMVVEFMIGLLGAVPFVSLLARWKRRKPTWTASVGHIAVAGIASIAAMIAAVMAAGLQRPGVGMFMPVLIAGAVVGVTARTGGLILPDGSEREGSR